MTTVTEITAYRDRLAGLPEEAFCGSLLWFSITGTIDRQTGARIQVPVRVTREQLEAWFLEFGLDTQFLPPQILKVDAFRKSTSNIVRTYDMADGRFSKLFVEEVVSNTDFVERHVVRQIRDPRQPQDEDKLATEWMATLKFFRGGRTNGTKRPSGDHYKSRARLGLSPQDASEVAAMLDDIETRYTDLAANLNEDKIRAVVRNYLTHLNAISVKPSGALYFVHNSRQAAVDALQALVHRIGQGCSFEQVPLLNTEQQKDMLTEAFQTEVEDDVRLLLGRIGAINEKAKTSGGLISATAYAEVNELYQKVAARSEEHTATLGLALGRAASALELALDQVMDLAVRIDPKGKK